MQNGGHSGLNNQQVAELLRVHGYNELPASGPKSAFRIAKEVLSEPMLLLLLACGALYFLLSDYREGLILFGAIVLIIFITFYQSRKTERAIEALRKLSTPRCMVFRNGIQMRIPGREIVPGDLVIVKEGDRIPADGCIIESTGMGVDESVLTGESMPVTKYERGSQGDEKQAMVYSGTLLVSGSGVLEITATGVRSEFGKIGLSLSKVEDEPTRLQKEMKQFIRRIAVVGIGLCVLVVIGFYFTRGGFIQALLTGLSAAMAILPEEFPVVMTVFLALGAWRISKKNVLTRKPSAIETLGSATVLCSDKTGTITLNKMKVVAYSDSEAVYAIRPAKADFTRYSSVSKTAFMAAPKTSSDPMEAAFRENGFMFSMNEEEAIREYAFSRELMCMSRVYRDDSGQHFVYTKGAPETIFKLCKMEADEIEKHVVVLHRFASEGLRVIGMASAHFPEGELPGQQQAFEFRFEGLLGLEDPVRPEVAEAVSECKAAGIRVVMITGDYPETGASIARQIGLDKEPNVLTGQQLDQMSDEALKTEINRVHVFARVVPEQKLRIVELLKSNNEVVAMTGDGVNDAPALKSAHIGIAMGKKGTDVAREASSLVLVDDNFASIVASVRLGRRIYDNLQKAMGYILAIHVPIVGLTLLPAFVSVFPLLLLPVHIIFMELIIDPVCSVAFETEPEEKGIMHRPPRHIHSRFFGSRRILYSVFQGVVLLAVVLMIYFLSVKEGHSEEEVRSIAFVTLIMANVGLILSDLSATRYVFQVLAEPNWSAKIIIVAALLVLVLALTVPALQSVFHFSKLDFVHFLPSLAGAGTTILIFELIKFNRLRRIKNRIE